MADVLTEADRAEVIRLLRATSSNAWVIDSLSLDYYPTDYNSDHIDDWGDRYHTGVRLCCGEVSVAGSAKFERNRPSVSALFGAVRPWLEFGDAHVALREMLTGVVARLDSKGEAHYEFGPVTISVTHADWRRDAVRRTLEPALTLGRQLATLRGQGLWSLVIDERKGMTLGGLWAPRVAVFATFPEGNVDTTFIPTLGEVGSSFERLLPARTTAGLRFGAGVSDRSGRDFRRVGWRTLLWADADVSINDVRHVVARPERAHLVDMPIADVVGTGHEIANAVAAALAGTGALLPASSPRRNWAEALRRTPEPTYDVVVTTEDAFRHVVDCLRADDRLFEGNPERLDPFARGPKEPLEVAINTLLRTHLNPGCVTSERGVLVVCIMCGTANHVRSLMSAMQRFHGTRLVGHRPLSFPAPADTWTQVDGTIHQQGWHAVFVSSPTLAFDPEPALSRIIAVRPFAPLGIYNSYDPETYHLERSESDFAGELIAQVVDALDVLPFNAGVLVLSAGLMTEMIPDNLQHLRPYATTSRRNGKKLYIRVPWSHPEPSAGRWYQWDLARVPDSLTSVDLDDGNVDCDDDDDGLW